MSRFCKVYDSAGFEEWINLDGIQEVAVEQTTDGVLIVDVYCLVERDKAEWRLTGKNALRLLIALGIRAAPEPPVPEPETRLVRDFTDIRTEPSPPCEWDDA